MEKSFPLTHDGHTLHFGGAIDGKNAFGQAASWPKLTECSKATKLVFAAAMTLVLLLTVFFLAGCASKSDSGEEVIRVSLTEELEAVKSFDDSFVEEALAGMGDAGFEQFGISAEEFLTEYLEGFDYAIDAVEIDEDEAWATVTFRCKSFKSLCSLIEYESKRALGNRDVSALGEEELSGLVAEVVLSSLEQVEVSACDPVIFEYELVNGEWVQSDSYASVLVDALTSN